MSKDDIADMPRTPPHKRRALHSVPDVWLAVWADSDILTPAERRRVREERDRRKAVRGRENLRVALVRGNEGMTPVQREAMMRAIPDHASDVVPINMAAGSESTRAAIANAGFVLAAPREMTMPNNVPTWERSPVWAAVAYAKNRRIPVTIILPNGEEGRFE